MERFLDRFLCCCVNTLGPHEQLGFSGETFGGAGAAEAEWPSQSQVPQFPMQEMGKFPKGGSALLGPDEANDAMTARSNGSLGSMSAEEKEREKSRLQRLVKDFAKEAVTGIAVSLVNPQTTRHSPYFFQMDRYLTVFSLKPKDGSTAESTVQDFNVKDLTSIYKGVDVAVKAPSIGVIAAHCVGLDTNRADRRLFFHFDDSYERDKFYTCLKILRMSVDINRSA